MPSRIKGFQNHSKKSLAACSIFLIKMRSCFRNYCNSETFCHNVISLCVMNKLVKQKSKSIWIFLVTEYLSSCHKCRNDVLFYVRKMQKRENLVSD